MEELLTLPGVGRKTANLVLILAHSEPGEHLRRHARSPDFESSRLGGDPHAGGNRAGAVRCRRAAMVADHQPVSRDVGTERVPAGVSALRELRDRGFVSRRLASRRWGRRRERQVKETRSDRRQDATARRRAKEEPVALQSVFSPALASQPRCARREPTIFKSARCLPSSLTPVMPLFFRSIRQLRKEGDMRRARC